MSVVAVAMGVGLAACGSDQPGDGKTVHATPAPTGSAGTRQGDGRTFDVLRASMGSADVVRTYDSVGQAVAMTAAGDPSAPALAVVRGDVTAVEPGVSNSWTLTDDGEDRTILPFGDENSEIDTYHLTIEVSDVIAQVPKTDLGPTLTVGIALPPHADLAQVRSDVEQVDDAVFFVEESPVFDYQPGLLGISENGTLIGFVDGDSVDYPLLAAPDAFTADGGDLAALKSAARS